MSVNIDIKSIQTSNNENLLEKDKINGIIDEKNVINNTKSELTLKTVSKAEKEENDVKDDEEIEDEERRIFTKELKPIIIKKMKPIENVIGQRHIQKEESRNKDTTIIPKQLKQKHVLSVADTIISLVIIGPLVIGHWRGIWNLMDYYNLPISGWLCFLLGTGLHWIFAVLRGVLHGQFAVSWRSSNPIGRGGYRGIRLVYTYIFCVSCNMQWRGGWIVLSSMMGENEWVISFVICILISLLIIFRSFRNLLAPPLIIAVDIPNYIFQFPTRYRTICVATLATYTTV